MSERKADAVPDGDVRNVLEGRCVAHMSNGGTAAASTPQSRGYKGRAGRSFDVEAFFPVSARACRVNCILAHTLVIRSGGAGTGVGTAACRHIFSVGGHGLRTRQPDQCADLNI